MLAITSHHLGDNPDPKLAHLATSPGCPRGKQQGGHSLAKQIEHLKRKYQREVYDNTHPSVFSSSSESETFSPDKGRHDSAVSLSADITSASQPDELVKTETRSQDSQDQQQKKNRQKNQSKIPSTRKSNPPNKKSEKSHSPLPPPPVKQVQSQPQIHRGEFNLGKTPTGDPNAGREPRKPPLVRWPSEILTGKADREFTDYLGKAKMAVSGQLEGFDVKDLVERHKRQSEPFFARLAEERAAAERLRIEVRELIEMKRDLLDEEIKLFTDIVVRLGKMNRARRAILTKKEQQKVECMKIEVRYGPSTKTESAYQKIQDEQMAMLDGYVNRGRDLTTEDELETQHLACKKAEVERDLAQKAHTLGDRHSKLVEYVKDELNADFNLAAYAVAERKAEAIRKEREENADYQSVPVKKSRYSARDWDLAMGSTYMSPPSSRPLYKAPQEMKQNPTANDFTEALAITTTATTTTATDKKPKSACHEKKGMQAPRWFTILESKQTIKLPRILPAERFESLWNLVHQLLVKVEEEELEGPEVGQRNGESGPAKAEYDRVMGEIDKAMAEDTKTMRKEMVA